MGLTNALSEGSRQKAVCAMILFYVKVKENKTIGYSKLEFVWMHVLKWYPSNGKEGRDHHLSMDTGYFCNRV